MPLSTPSVTRRHFVIMMMLLLLFLLIKHYKNFTADFPRIRDRFEWFQTGTTKNGGGYKKINTPSEFNRTPQMVLRQRRHLTHTDDRSWRRIN